MSHFAILAWFCWFTTFLPAVVVISRVFLNSILTVVACVVSI